MKLEGFIRFMVEVVGGSIVVGDIVQRPKWGTYQYHGYEYRVLTDAEADAAVAEMILEKVPYFDTDKLAELMSMNVQLVEKMQQLSLTEIKEIIERHSPGGFAGMCKRCVTDRGLFLAPYDQLEQKCGDLYFYRVS